ncbi:sodium-dependent transporter [Salinilacihabitans rarus]|uniref:sodium-dependent transporter n=1 Tax=Salinilacihabitans rarus TaxID=2961596 RepID=UPI0020C92FC2|nr:sodium-dependent transporter [Salinilacihabitans rarus]
MAQRETWATRTGFILAAVGSAVGLGNIWRFPFLVGQEGGAAFLVVYLLFVALIGFPAMLVEFVVGRRTNRNPVGALKELGGGVWQYLGWVFAATGFIILSYYSVVGGWVLRYVLIGLQGGYVGDIEGAGGQFVEAASGLDAVLGHAIFMAAVIAIVGFGIRRGIEFAVQVMVPAIILIAFGLAVYAFTLPGASEAYAFYLSPDVGEILANWTDILPAAAGQAFFTLSLGMGAMITYASYIGDDRNLAEDGLIIVGLDTLIAFTAGLIVFPIFFTGGVDPANTIGAGAIFISLAAALGDLSFGWLIGTVFFGTIAIAALSSAISLLEVVVSYLIDERGMERFTATAIVGTIIFVVGIPTALDLVFIDLYDLFANNILLVFGGLMVSIFVGWVISNVALDEIGRGVRNLGSWGDVWIWLVRIPVIVILFVTIYLGVFEYYEFLTGDFADWLGQNL